MQRWGLIVAMTGVLGCGRAGAVHTMSAIPAPITATQRQDLDAASASATTDVVTDAPDAATTTTTTGADAAPAPQGPHRAPQFVLVGLDATPGWDTEHTFSRRVGDLAEQAHGRITYFVNTQNFLIASNRRRDPTLTERDRAWLDPNPRMFGFISYARTADQAEGRLVTTKYLIEHGHEIASHGVHHERGTQWTARQWQREFEVFNRFHEERLGLPTPVGFRAPYLSPGPNVGPAEQALGMLYDASLVNPHRSWPGRLRGTNVWEIGVMSLNSVRGCRTVIFDDGLRMCHMRDESLFQGLKDEFLARYNGNRAPFILSSHDGFVESVYIRILREVCTMPEVRCTTFSEVARFMNAHPALSLWGNRLSQQSAPMIETD